jgi:hypothetical protein
MHVLHGTPLLRRQYLRILASNLCMCHKFLYVTLQILIIGKSINFLRQSCHDHTQLGGSSLRTWFLNEDGMTFISACVTDDLM